MNDSFRDPRLTERRNAETADIDVASSMEIVDAMNAADRGVPEAVAAVREEVARAVDLVVEAFQSGGRLLYVGAGTSGRLGVIDAAECPPTFGTDPDLVVAVIAGGPEAVFRSREGAEDDEEGAIRDLERLSVSPRDVVVGIAASGTTPYVRSALLEAASRGAAPVLVTCTDPAPDVGEVCRVVISAKVGPEVLTGSTRLKAGTATKLILNSISTAAMIRSGRAYGNLMVDLRAASAKLRDRGERIVMEVCRVDREAAREAIESAAGRVKLAIVMLKLGLDAEAADQALEQAGGLVRRAVGDPPPVPE